MIRIISIFLILISWSCSQVPLSSNQKQDPNSIFTDITAEILMPFAENSRLVLVKVIDNPCNFSICDSIQKGQEYLCVFVMEHQATQTKPRFKALNKTYPGLKKGDIIKMKTHLKRNYKEGKVSVQVHDYEVL